MAKKSANKTVSVGQITDAEEKKKALDVTMAHLEKNFGSGAIMRLGDDKIQDIEAISTGSIGLDFALGVGGVPRGRITEIFGPESSGKTTLAIHIIAEAQKQGGICAIIDAEHAFDRFYAERLGVDVNNLWIAQPDNGEQALDIAEQLINSGAIDVLVIDSVAALTPKAEVEGVMGDKNVGLHARLMSQAMRKLTGTISKTRTCCIFINQIREKIGLMFGNPETTTGGNALKFYSSVRIDIRPAQFIKEGDNPVGRIAKIKVVKNKVAPPFMKTEVEMLFGQGISRAGEALDLAVEYDIVKKSGAWFSYNGAKLGQGRDSVRNSIAQNPELLEELVSKVKAKIEELRKDNKIKRAAPILSSKKTESSADEEEAEENLEYDPDETQYSDSDEDNANLFNDDFELES